MRDLEIRRVEPDTVMEVIALFEEQVYLENPEEAYDHFADHASGGGDSCLAYVEGALAGYVTIRWQSNNPLFRDNGIPLIHHLGVFDSYQRQGIASRLMDAAEQLIATRTTRAGITVGLFDAYGPAQRFYAKRGYTPDGRGLCQGRRPLAHGEVITLDHDIILWLTKDLATEAEQ